MTTTTDILAEGKTKVLTPGESGDEVRVRFKDDATAFNAEKHTVVAGKGELNARISAILFTLLNDYGVPTCFAREGDQPGELVYRRLAMIPLEVVVRNVALGSVVKRYGAAEGRRFETPVVEFFHKSASDPLISDDLIEAFGLLPDGVSIRDLKRLSQEINELFVDFFEVHGVLCADFKLEFGVDSAGKLRVGDELSPDNFRLRDAETGQVLDKDVFRLDLADLKETYSQLLARIQQPAQLPQKTRTYRAEVFVHSRKGILSPESRTILESLNALGMGAGGNKHVETLHAGKHFQLTLVAPTMIEADRQLAALAKDVLSNPVIEDVTYNLWATGA